MLIFNNDISNVIEIKLRYLTPLSRIITTFEEIYEIWK